jgi:hypothetical protein
LSTLAVEGTGPGHDAHGASALRWADLVLLAAALPVFALAGWPMLGYAVAAAAWLAQRAIRHIVSRRSAGALAAGDRRSAMGLLAASTLGRVWLVMLAVLLIGLLADREDGLAAALLATALFTTYLCSAALERMLGPHDGGRP